MVLQAGGLSQFDGYQFTNYGTAEGLASARVETLLETRAGDYWVGTAAGLYHFNPKSKGSARLTVYRPDDPRTCHVLAIFEDRAGNLWIGTQNGLYQFTPSAFGRNSARGRGQAPSGWRFVDTMAEKPIMSVIDEVCGSYRDTLEYQARQMEPHFTRPLEVTKATGHLRLTETGLEVVIHYPVDLENSSQNR